MSAEVRWSHSGLQAMMRSDGVVKDLARRAVKVTSAAKRYCPVDTGRLRSSIYFVLGTDDRGVFALIGSDVVYAIFVELGTSRMKAQPYLRPALRDAA